LRIGQIEESTMRFDTAMTGAMLIAVVLSSSSALAADNEAGVPLSPAEAAGPWTIQTGGHAVCTLQLGADHKVQAGDCGAALPGQPAAWQATPDGMKLVDASGQPVLAFGRWSNSLFVAHRSSGEDLQLRRGGPGAP
jgi:hypothetical protein